MTTWTPEQQAEHRKLWVEALRSGKYQQARAVLRNAKGGMCCLGVACEISGLGKWSAARDYETNGALSTTLPPREVVAWLGLDNANGSWSERDDDMLTIRNDKGASFAEIADIIESAPPGLLAKATP